VRRRREMGGRLRGIVALTKRDRLELVSFAMCRIVIGGGERRMMTSLIDASAVIIKC
jgi:hypothetical protein